MKKSGKLAISGIPLRFQLCRTRKGEEIHDFESRIANFEFNPPRRKETHCERLPDAIRVWNCKIVGQGVDDVGSLAKDLQLAQRRKDAKKEWEKIIVFALATWRLGARMK